ncbi:acid protease [Aaosphaeria arxii CBS 175.79]|uniref:Acid protease n=1 Tax=Aaosphaeria arxii CBS 175.79 TaxID=1450172 RepID=A0A6A5Y5G2_9PLEO|nr:acid protease [Aaosphaeria arxii CBS 175.79]KAF2020795.1 acid protease [Aaosphaeria arxii CBS 175.79]
MGDEDRVVPSPFVFGTGDAWEGYDGPWSAFTIHVGTPGQDFNILPSTSGAHLILPISERCTSGIVLPKYTALRDANSTQLPTTGFRPNASITWKPSGPNNSLGNQQLANSDNKIYGLDKIEMFSHNSTGLVVTDQVISGTSIKDHQLGFLGLDARLSKSPDSNYPHRSLLTTLREDNKIPSLSFAYTAGAAYRIPKVAGSLTLGGYDASRFKANDQTFPFSNDEDRRLEISIEQISLNNTLSGSHSLLHPHILSLIDSTYPHIWLPRATCDSFEQAFGLTYDAPTDLYLVNSTIHQRLQSLNPTITFHLGSPFNPTTSVTIALPYSAFSLQHQQQQPNNASTHSPSYYFPLRRAPNDTHSILGRTFLQEAYLITDYDRSTFSLHQSVFPDPLQEPDIVSILPPPPVPPVRKEFSYTSHSPNGIPKGAVIGIAAGVGFLVLVLLALFIVMLRRRRRRAGRRAVGSTTRVLYESRRDIRVVKSTQDVMIH